MSFGLTEIIQFLNSPSFTLWQIVVLVYIGLLWLSLIVWVTRDAISRSNSLSFQIFAILLTIIIPLLGVILYLIIRPGRTHIERYYEELEKHLFEEKEEDGQTCKKCLTILDKTFIYCPNCLEKLKKTCNKCHQSFPDPWNSCPYCGSIQKESVKKVKLKVPLKK